MSLIVLVLMPNLCVNVKQYYRLVHGNNSSKSDGIQLKRIKNKISIRPNHTRHFELCARAREWEEKVQIDRDCKLCKIDEGGNTYDLTSGCDHLHHTLTSSPSTERIDRHGGSFSQSLRLSNRCRSPNGYNTVVKYLVESISLPEGLPSQNPNWKRTAKRKQKCSNVIESNGACVCVCLCLVFDACAAQ